MSVVFSEATKLAVKKRAHFACCLCHDVGVEVHHLVPQSEDGPDDEDNAAPLCPSCHERYGANPAKRKFIREARDFWYEVCSTRFAPDTDRLAELSGALQQVATKADLATAVEQLTSSGLGRSTEAPRQLPESLAGQPLSADSLRAYLRWMYPTIPHCGTTRSARFVKDLTAVGYSNIDELHSIVGETKEAMGQFLQDERDRGKPMDQAADDFPFELFLALFDERYCQLRFPKAYANREPHQPWRRPA